MPSHVYQLFIDGVTQRCRSDLISVQAQFLSSCPVSKHSSCHLVQCPGTVLVILSTPVSRHSSCPVSRHSSCHLVQCPGTVLVQCSGTVLFILSSVQAQSFLSCPVPRHSTCQVFRKSSGHQPRQTHYNYFKRQQQSGIAGSSASSAAHLIPTNLQATLVSALSNNFVKLNKGQEYCLAVNFEFVTRI